MTITSDDLCQFTSAIWESTLGFTVQPIAELSPTEERACTLMGEVHIQGAWRGAVSLECSEELARKGARAMFGLGSGEPTPEEVRDALAEITNVTAGNLKSLAHGPCQLMTPQVAERARDLPATPHPAVLSRQAFVCQGEPFVVTLFED